MKIVLMAAGVVVVSLVLVALVGLVAFSKGIAELYMPDELERDYI